MSMIRTKEEKIRVLLVGKMPRLPVVEISFERAVQNSRRMTKFDLKEEKSQHL